MITYTITKTKYTVNPDGTPDRITLVIWNASSSNESVVGTIRGRGTPIPNDYTPADAAYDTLTEQDLINWVVDLEDQVTVQEQLDAVIAAIESPTEGTGLPWQEQFPLWAINVPYVIGSVVIYQNTGYECIQAHTSQSTWAPPATPALWKSYVPPSEGPQYWVQPTGAQDAYALGAQVTHTGNLWTSLVDANVWEPTTANSTLWQDEGVYP